MNIFELYKQCGVSTLITDINPMKRIIYAISLLAFISLSNTLSAQTTVQNGNWSDPMTWGGTIPITTGTVVINHKVTLDIDYAHNSGSITINASGALTGNSIMRGFALNYPSGSANLTVDGDFNVSRTALLSGTVNIGGTLEADSLLNNSTLTNGGTITATQLFNNTGGMMTNTGTINALNFLNIETLTSYGTIDATDFFNSKYFTNATGANMTVNHDFLNLDSLASPAILTNDGSIVVQHDFRNGDQINGSGKFCIYNNTWNSGAITGTIDFCDQTGNDFDLNTGTIAGTVTYCANPCFANIKENTSKDLVVEVYPNPFTTSTTLQTETPLNNATLTLYNSYGQIVQQLTNINGQSVTIFRDNLSNGLYFMRLTEDNRLITAKKLEINN